MATHIRNNSLVRAKDGDTIIGESNVIVYEGSSEGSFTILGSSNDICGYDASFTAHHLLVFGDANFIRLQVNFLTVEGDANAHGSKTWFTYQAMVKGECNDINEVKDEVEPSKFHRTTKPIAVSSSGYNKDFSRGPAASSSLAGYATSPKASSPSFSPGPIASSTRMLEGATFNNGKLNVHPALVDRSTGGGVRLPTIKHKPRPAPIPIHGTQDFAGAMMSDSQFSGYCTKPNSTTISRPASSSSTTHVMQNFGGASISDSSVSPNRKHVFEGEYSVHLPGREPILVGRESSRPSLHQTHTHAVPDPPYIPVFSPRPCVGSHNVPSAPPPDELQLLSDSEEDMPPLAKIPSDPDFYEVLRSRAASSQQVVEAPAPISRVAPVRDKPSSCSFEEGGPSKPASDASVKQSFTKPAHLSAKDDVVADDDCPPSDVCRSCMEKKKRLTWLPCGHRFACIGCTYEWADECLQRGDVTCPFCKKPSSGVMEIFDC